MSNELLGTIVVVVVFALIVAGIVSMIRTPKTGSGAASLTAFHDLQPSDKQKAMETIIEMKAGKRQEEDLSGWNEKSREKRESLEEKIPHEGHEGKL